MSVRRGYALADFKTSWDHYVPLPATTADKPLGDNGVAGSGSDGGRDESCAMLAPVDDPVERAAIQSENSP